MKNPAQSKIKLKARRNFSMPGELTFWNAINRKEKSVAIADKLTNKNHNPRILRKIVQNVLIVIVLSLYYGYFW